MTLTNGKGFVPHEHVTRVFAVAPADAPPRSMSSTATAARRRTAHWRLGTIAAQLGLQADAGR
jgi:hypothetical protein